MSINGTQSEVITLEKQMNDLRYETKTYETEAETKTNDCQSETETETKKS